MKEYKSKSFEELQWEDYRAGRKEGGLLHERSEKPVAEEELQGADLTVPREICRRTISVVENGEDGDLLKEKDPVNGVADEELHLAKIEAKNAEGGKLLKEREIVKEVDGRLDKLPFANSSGGGKLMTPIATQQGCDIGVIPVEVRKKDGVVEEKAVGGEPAEISSMLTQIVSMRPKLKKKVKK